MMLDATAGHRGPGGEVEDKPPDVDHLQHERRFLPTGAELQAFIKAVEAGPLPADAKALPPATTTWTTYFDTEDWIYLHSCDGPTAQRLRVREYEGPRDEGLATPCCLELKQTTGTSRSKVRLTAPISTLARLIGGAHDVDEQLAGSVAFPTIRRALEQRHLAPCLGTSYRRRCLASTPELRVTVDEDLTFFHPVTFGLPRENDNVVALGPSLVLEVKYAGALPVWLSRACESLKEAPGFSKFRVGMLAVRMSSVAVSQPNRATLREPLRNTSDSLARSAARQWPSL